MAPLSEVTLIWTEFSFSQWTRAKDEHANHVEALLGTSVGLRARSAVDRTIERARVEYALMSMMRRYDGQDS